jgi:CBS domain-containing protein
MGWLAEDVMTRNVLCVYVDMDLRELQKLFLDRQITGAPVTARDGTLIGVVSQTDLLRYGSSREEELTLEPEFYQSARLEGQHLPKGFQFIDATTGTVSDVLTPIVHSVKEKTPVTEVARLMRSKRVHRVIVERDRRVLGIISALDLVAVLSSAAVRGSRAKKKKTPARSRRR